MFSGTDICGICSRSTTVGAGGAALLVLSVVLVVGADVGGIRKNTTDGIGGVLVILVLVFPSSSCRSSIREPVKWGHHFFHIVALYNGISTE